MSKRDWTKTLIWLFTYGMSSALLAKPADYINLDDIIIQQTLSQATISDATTIQQQSVGIGVSPSTHFQQPAGGIALNHVDSVQAISISENLGCIASTDYTILVNPAGIFSESAAEHHHCINSHH